ncbi:MAG: Ig-like domain-containing protein [Candidatus Staskawiczbacteria bacterium]|jgi:hypothetical protein
MKKYIFLASLLVIILFVLAQVSLFFFDLPFGSWLRSVKNSFWQTAAVSKAGENVSLTGELVQWHLDDIQGKKSKNLFSLKLAGQEYSLDFEQEVEEMFIEKTVATVTGKKTGNKIRVSRDGLQIVSKPNPKIVPMDFGPTTKKVAVILFNFQDNTAQPWTVDNIRAKTFTDPTSVKAYYNEASFEKLILSSAIRGDGDVFGWYTVPFPEGVNCLESTNRAWAQNAETQAAANGFIKSNYDAVIYAFPWVEACSGWSGWTFGIGSSQVWINGSYSLYTVGHELGHVFGVNHASTYNCTNSQGARVPISDTCTTNEYGDPFDIMGYPATKHFSGFHKAQLPGNWFGSNNIQTVSADGTFTLRPLESGSEGLQSLRIPKDIDSQGLATSYYYLEYRQPLGFDNFNITDPVVNGVSVRLASDYSSSGFSRLIDNTSATASFSDSALAAGNTFTDSAKGISITTMSVSAPSDPDKKAVVSIDINPGCARANPLATFTPSSQTGNRGETLTYSVNITNNDTTSCSSSIFALALAIPSGWLYSASSEQVTLNPGESQTIDLDVTASQNATAGSFVLPLLVSDIANPNRLVSKKSYYEVIDCGNSICENKEDFLWCPSDCNAYRVFVSSTSYSGNLGGVSGADATCQALAQAAGLTGNWMAYLGDNSTGPMERLFQAVVDRPYKLVNGTLLATNRADLADRTVSAPINVAEDGSTVPSSDVWTGSNSFNVRQDMPMNYSDARCYNWTSNKSAPLIGISGTNDNLGAWDGVKFPSCSNYNRLYCFEKYYADTTPPAVAITTPINGFVLPSKGTVIVSADAADQSGISKIEIFIDNVSKQVCSNINTCPYSWNVQGVTRGTHSIKVDATDGSIPANISSTNIVVTK